MKKLLLSISLLTLAACAGNTQTADAVQKPTGWTNQSIAAQNVNTAQMRWWEQLNDPVLNQLVQTALQQNLDVKIAATRVRAARAELLAVEASFLPDINGSGTVRRARSSEKTSLGAAGGGTRNLYDVGMDSTWEFNIFGISPAIEAADATMLSEQENLNGAVLSLLGEVAHNYIELRRLQNTLAVTDASIAAYQTSLDLASARQAAGLASAIDSTRAQSALQSQKSMRPQLQAQISAALRRLEVLLAQNPGTLEASLAAPAAIPAAQSPMLLATPASVIANRPDIRAAEQNLRARNATVSVATAQYFPSISLPAAFGWQAVRSGDLFAGSSLLWSLAGTVKVPVFDFGRIRADVDLSEANAEAAFLGYQKTVQTALGDVETALADYLAAVNRSQQLQAATDASQQTVNLVTQRYDAGLVSFLEVVEAQKTLYAAQASQLQNQADMASRLVTLYKSMGGGWQPDGASATPEQPLAQPQPTQPAVPDVQTQIAPPSAAAPVMTTPDTRPNAPRVQENSGVMVIE